MRSILSKKYLRGAGIEIGGLHCPLPVAEGVRVTYVDRDPYLVRSSHTDVKIAVSDWIVDDAAELRHFDLSSQDFIIANHVMEHLTNPIRAFFTWCDRLKPGGIMFISLPDKDKCFDRRRVSTTFEHLLSDWMMPSEDRNLEHYIDWFLNSELELLTLDDAMKAAKKAWGLESNIHFHVWDERALGSFILSLVRLGRDTVTLVETCVNGGELIFILRKSG